MTSLNLRNNLVEQFWETQDPKMKQLLFSMSHVEHWRLDTIKAVAEALGPLALKLERARPDVLNQNMERLVQLMAYLSSPRAMYLLEWLSSRHEQLAIALLQTAAEMNDPCGLLLIDRVQTIKSVSLLGAIFSPENVHNVTQLLRQINPRT